MIQQKVNGLHLEGAEYYINPSKIGSFWKYVEYNGYTHEPKRYTINVSGFEFIYELYALDKGDILWEQLLNLPSTQNELIKLKTFEKV